MNMINMSATSVNTIMTKVKQKNAS